MPKATEEPICEFSECDENGTSCCEICNTYFCTEHGQRGRDYETESGLRAYPSICWKCKE